MLESGGPENTQQILQEASWGVRCHARWTQGLTCLRRQKRRGRRHEKRYLPHRIRQEKHQLSLVMVTPSSRAPGQGGGSMDQAGALQQGWRSPAAPQERTRASCLSLGGRGPRGSYRVAPTWLHLSRSRGAGGCEALAPSRTSSRPAPSLLPSPAQCRPPPACWAGRVYRGADPGAPRRLGVPR